MIPLIQEEVVEVRACLSAEEFLDAFALGNTLPGPIATKMSACVGYKVMGVPGSAVGLLGMVLPTAVLMIALLAAYLGFRNHLAIAGFLNGVRPIVVALLLVAYEFAPRALGTHSELRTHWPYWIVAIAAFWLCVRFSIHPAILIVIGGALGALVFS